MDASPEPDHDADDAWEEDRFHSHPDFGEACFRILQYVQNIIETKNGKYQQLTAVLVDHR